MQMSGICQLSRRRSDLRRGVGRQSRVLHDVERNAGRPGEPGAAEGSRNDLVVAAARA